MPASDALRNALQVFIHDLRAPISVAQGYLRLILEHRLPDAEARDRALAQTMESLARLTGLCDDASEFLTVHESTRPSRAPLPLARLMGALRAALAQRGAAAEIEMPADGWILRVAQPDVVATRILTILELSRRHQAGGDAVVRITPRDGSLCILTGTPRQCDVLLVEAPAEIDRWRGGLGLKLALACLDVERHGGRVWTTATAWPGLGVTLPMEWETA